MKLFNWRTKIKSGSPETLRNSTHTLGSHVTDPNAHPGFLRKSDATQKRVVEMRRSLITKTGTTYFDDQVSLETSTEIKQLYTIKNNCALYITVTNPVSLGCVQFYIGESVLNPIACFIGTDRALQGIGSPIYLEAGTKIWVSTDETEPTNHVFKFYEYKIV